MSATRPVRRALRALTAPVRGYVNRSFEHTKDEARRLAAEERAAQAHETETVLAAIGRLEEAIGFVGLQVAALRAEVDELAAQTEPAAERATTGCAATEP
jgi:hypothetical protein